MILTKSQRLDIAVGKALNILDNFMKYMDLQAVLGPNNSPTLEMDEIAEASKLAAKNLIEVDPELMKQILPPQLIEKTQINETSSTNSLLVSSQSIFINAEDSFAVEQGGFQINYSTTKPTQYSNNSTAVVQYISRWINTYQNNHFNFMKQTLDSCNNLFLKSQYNTIAFAIERRFAKVFSAKEKSSERSLGKVKIISTRMPIEVFQLWTSFQYFFTSATPFERCWDMNSNFSTWSHFVILDSYSVPVFQTKKYFKWEYQKQNISTKQKEYYRMYTYKMDLEYEFESQLFTVVAYIRKEKYSVTNLRWQIRE